MPEQEWNEAVAAADHYGREFWKMVQAIGPGYHPDTAGAEYERLPEGYTADDVDFLNEATAAALAEVGDVTVYDLAYELYQTPNQRSAA